MKRALLIFNPAAGGWRDSRERAQRIAARLLDRGVRVEIAQTKAPGHAAGLARQARGLFDAVFAYGGDGTLRECAAGLLGSTTPLGFLPGGTANVMSRTFRLPANPLTAADLLADGRIETLDVGLCGGEPMLMQASAGLDAEVLAQLEPKRKRLLGKAEVALCFPRAWWRYDYPRFSVRWADQERRVSFAAACNVSFYGGPWRIAPDARLSDGLLDLVMFSGRGRAATLSFARDLFLGRHLRRPDVEMARVAAAEFGAAPGLGLQVDGDRLSGGLPARLEIATERVRFLVPRSVAIR